MSTSHRLNNSLVRWQSLDTSRPLHLAPAAHDALQSVTFTGSDTFAGSSSLYYLQLQQNLIQASQIPYSKAHRHLQQPPHTPSEHLSHLILYQH
ncbi:Hypothetical protein NTJ_03612 [Nesidiocoris tenuis]|uniref:Uncharacterized protein n=1 Tax=Nesidiocoris tenuis TaxID=355587 RepID=A0ABN7AEY2_9HEMI|nr:Hypothetical protein NTJ_03612 [Nesidiocoris tenuis]